MSAIDRLRSLKAELARVMAERDADRAREYGYSQETVDALQKELAEARRDAERIKSALIDVIAVYPHGGAPLFAAITRAENAIDAARASEDE